MLYSHVWSIHLMGWQLAQRIKNRIFGPQRQTMRSVSALCRAAEKSSIYTYPGAILPILNPLMKALAHFFPDKGITQVSARLCPPPASSSVMLS